MRTIGVRDEDIAVLFDAAAAAAAADAAAAAAADTDVDADATDAARVVAAVAAVTNEIFRWL